MPGNTAINTAAYYGKVSLSGSGNITPSIDRVDLGTGVQIKYVVSENRVDVIRSGSTIASFTASDLDNLNSGDGTAQFFKDYISIPGSGTVPTETLELHVPRIAGVPLLYTRFGTYEKTNVNLFPLSGSLDPLTVFVFGQPTAAGNTPTNGSATYSADLLGAVIQESGELEPDIYALGGGHGSATFSANFATGLIDTLISLDADGKDFGDLTGSGAIVSGGPAFHGDLTGAGTGGFTGAFFGPSALEMGYVFQAQGVNGGADFITYGNVFGIKGAPPPP